MTSRLKVVLLNFLIIYHAESCSVQPVQKKHPCFNVKEVTPGYESNVTVYQANISDKSVCTEVKMNYKYITHIDPDAFKGLANLCVVNLNINRISFLKAQMFRDLTALKKLFLSRNKICSLAKGTFKHLALLEELDLSYNYIKELHKNSLLGLLSLKKLDLSRNGLCKLEESIFLGLKLNSIQLNHNYLKVANLYFADHSIAPQSLNEGDFTISDLKHLQNLDLYGNNITHINTLMFAMLTGLKGLYVHLNLVWKIDGLAFKDLESLMYLYLSKNNLTKLSNQMFIGLVNLKILKLDGNKIYHIEENTFADMVSVQKTVQIRLRYNKLSELSWTVFVNSSSSMRPNGVNVNSFELDMDITATDCKRSHCWFKHSEWKTFEFNIRTTINGDVKVLLHNALKQMCDGKLKEMCPSKANWCMYLENNTCELQCKKTGKPGGDLIIDGDVCPFQYFCKCSCPSCAQKCAAQEKIHVEKSIDKYGCSICNCQCDNSPNCWKKCSGDNFVLKNNTDGCALCSCLCPSLKCDANCTGEESAIIKKDERGCKVCPECRHMVRSQGGSKTLIYVIVPSTLCVIALFSLTICFICFHKRHTKDNNFTQEVRLTFLETLTKNLDPELAQQVKESWFDPKTLCIKQLLGNGQFGLIWSGTFEKSVGRKFPAAVKVAKAEFRDAWTVQTRWNSKHELKPHFEKRPIQIKVDNQVIADLLTEAMIMKKFDHCNVLKIFGVSAYEEKPCIILPFMANGDLKKYLITNKQSLSNKQLAAFALGVAKGMAHLAEKSFVHCDLAARNCLLDINLVVKVSDFGLSKNINDVDYYKLKNEGKPIPVRWMSVESLKLKKFTFESDVWSFGVVSWEVFSYGQLPYVNINNMDVMKYLLEGYRLEKPVSCPESMFEIMQSCWDEDPSRRPGFDTIVNMINGIADEEADYTEVKDEPESTCMKTDNI